MESHAGIGAPWPSEITVNGIAPGVVEWPKDYPAQQREQYLKRVPLGQAGTPADVAEAVLFLATTGSYLTRPDSAIGLEEGRCLNRLIRTDGGSRVHQGRDWLVPRPRPTSASRLMHLALLPAVGDLPAGRDP